MISFPADFSEDPEPNTGLPQDDIDLQVAAAAAEGRQARGEQLTPAERLTIRRARPRESVEN